MADVVEIFLTLRNARRFIEDANKSSTAISKIGTDAEKSGKKASIGWKGIAKWAGGAAALYGAARYIHGAVDATTELASSTMKVQRVTNMDTKTASAWVGVLRERGVNTMTFNRTLVQLSKQVETARTGTMAQHKSMVMLNKEYKATELLGGKKAPAALAKLERSMDSVRKKGDTSRATMKLLGVSMNDIGKGNTQQIILQIADRFEKMTNPMQRAALAQKLFGRSSQALLPLLMKGRKGIEDALNEHIKYGDVLGGKNVDDTKKLIAQERAMKAAMHGVQITLGTALMPAILGVVGAIVKLVNIFQPLIRQGWLVKTMLGVLVIAFIAYKGAVVAATIASWGLSAATWASIGIWVLVIAAIIAVGVAVYLAYKKFAWFRHGVQFVWQELKLGFEWVKSNWPLLLGILVGPFGLAAVLIITHFKTIKKFVVDVIDVIKRALQPIITMVENLAGKLGKIGGVFGKVGGVAGGVFKHLASGGVVQQAGGVIVGERGPEMLTLPAAATVTPLPQGQLALPGGTGAVQITVPLYLNNRMIAQAVAQYSADKLARR